MPRRQWAEGFEPNVRGASLLRVVSLEGHAWEDKLKEAIRRSRARGAFAAEWRDLHTLAETLVHNHRLAEVLRAEGNYDGARDAQTRVDEASRTLDERWLRPGDPSQERETR